MPLNRTRGCSLVLGLFALVTACNNGTNTDMSYKAAINDHYKAFPVCLWSQAKKFPVQAATSDDAKTEEYDALTQEGLLTRTTAEKRVLIIASKQVTTMTCRTRVGLHGHLIPLSRLRKLLLRHREVTSIDNSTLGTNGSGAKTVDVTYHYQLANVATWGEFAGNENCLSGYCFSLSANPSDQAMLVMSGDHWSSISRTGSI